MSAHTHTTHHPHGRKAGKGRTVPRTRTPLWLGSMYVAIIIGVLSIAGWLIWRALALNAGPAGADGVVTVEADMAGFSHDRIEVKVGQPVTVRLRSLDTPYHSDGGGKHQFAIDALGVNIIAPPKGTNEATFTPTQPGTYRFYCDICCGGKANPTMQGELVVTA